jgi:branched-chain amino acid transport system permease protein
VSTFTALLASGLAEGAIAAIAAVGFLITYKATGVVNFAQGALISLGAYIAFWLTQKNGAFGIGALGLVPGYIVAILIMFVIGMVLERLAYAPLRGRSVHVVVIATLGAAIVVQAFVSIWQGTSPLFLESPVQGDIVHVFGAAITWQRVLILIVTAIVITLTILLFQFTQFGRQLRATAADRDTARLYGVPVNMMSMLAFGIASALAALAGILIAPLGNLTVDLGFNTMLLGFAAAVLGGFGSLGGVVVGGIAIGLVEQLLGGYMVQWFGAGGLGDYKSVYPFVLMLIVIALRPQGLFTRGAGQRL